MLALIVWKFSNFLCKALSNKHQLLFIKPVILWPRRPRRSPRSKKPKVMRYRTITERSSATAGRPRKSPFFKCQHFFSSTKYVKRDLYVTNNTWNFSIVNNSRMFFSSRVNLTLLRSSRFDYEKPIKTTFYNILQLLILLFTYKCWQDIKLSIWKVEFCIHRLLILLF